MPTASRTAPSRSGRARARLVARAGHRRGRGQQGDQPDRDVDQEHPPPGRVDQQPADGRAERGGQGAGRGPDPHRPRAVLRPGSTPPPARGWPASAPPRRRPAPPGTPTSHQTPSLAAQPTLAAVNTASPVRNRPCARTGRRSGRPAPAARRRRSRTRSAPTTAAASVVPGKSRPIASKATLTMNRSRLAMNAAERGDEQRRQVDAMAWVGHSQDRSRSDYCQHKLGSRL